MTIKFACTSLSGLNKAGTLKPDEHGYYKTVIGALNILNSAGMYYDYKGTEELFEQSSSMMRRIKRGAMRSEVDHPQQRPGEKFDDFVARYMSIDPKNTCAHIADIELDFKNYKGPDGKPVVAIIGSVCPSGVHGEMLRKQFENPRENVCFSIRSLTFDYPKGGVLHRILKNVITFDYVNEPGIAIAEKYKSMALESLYEKTVTPEKMYRALSKPSTQLAMESSAMTATELFASLGWSLPGNEKPVFSRW